MENPKVSIIVPIYNVEKYLDRCMESLLNQTLEDIEIIMVDDGSPDNCPKMCDEYAKKDKRVKVIHKKNGGLGYARNSGLDIATGEYVAFVDSDDYTDLDAYRSLYDKAKESDADIVYAGFYNQHPDMSESVFFILDNTWVDHEIISFLSDMIFDEKPREKTVCMSMWNAVYKRDIIEKYHVRFQSEREIMSEDIVFHTTLLPLCHKVVCIPIALYHYCYNGESLTHTTFKQSKIDANIKLYETLMSISNKYGLKELNESIALFFLNYTRGVILKGILLSPIPIITKRRLCMRVYNYQGWDNVYRVLKGKKIPQKEALGLFLVKHKAFLINYLLYLYIYKILGKSKYGR